MLVSLLLTITFLVGFLRFVSMAYSFSMFLLNHFKKPLDLKSRYGENSWAVITGGANGIGRIKALELATHGFNIFIWDVNRSSLNTVKDDIRAINKDVKVITIYKDLAGGQELSFYKKLYDEVKDLDVSILVNNVGIITYDTYGKTIRSKVSSMIKLNVVLPTMLTSLFVKKLKSREKRSAIIVTSSCVGVVPSPPMSIYTASKAYSRFFGLGLAEELKDKIDVLTT